MNVLVTGAAGFIGSNLCERLERCPGIDLLTFEKGDTDQSLRGLLEKADFVYHLAGVMRPDDEKEFETVNVGLTSRICQHLLELERGVPIVFASSIQASTDTPYGISKSTAEDVLGRYALQSGARVPVFRLRNVFGKWARPNYTSVVATFCHSIARGLEIEISDPDRELSLIYIDDVVQRFIAAITEINGRKPYYYFYVTPVRSLTLGNLAWLIRSFHEARAGLSMPDLSDGFIRKLYGTYLSYLDPSDLSYALDKRCDDRGCLAEFIKSDSLGQIFVSRTVPGVTRGGHYHRTKAEKFLVLEGLALVRLQHMATDEAIVVTVSGVNARVVDIPPGYMHSIKNVGREPLITLFWASEPFDSKNPDTYRKEE